MFSKNLHKITSVLLSVFVLIMTMGMSVHSHYCSVTNVLSVSISQETTCCKSIATDSCPKGCCENKSELIQLDTKEWMPTAAIDLSLTDQILKKNNWSTDLLFGENLKPNDEYLVYKPPHTYRDIPLLIQSFLV